jgi:hypothetical protein
MRILAGSLQSISDHRPFRCHPCPAKSTISSRANTTLVARVCRYWSSGRVGFLFGNVRGRPIWPNRKHSAAAIDFSSANRTGTFLAPSSSHRDDDATIEAESADRDCREAAGPGANVIAGVLVVGQFVGEEPTSVWLVIAGAAIWAGLAGVTLIIAGSQS